ncbi:MAG: hypothetical protein JXA57_17885 [Armatimonadetes bacterium]|nr:hypothetical protein [Armatimonadota bacterium]
MLARLHILLPYTLTVAEDEEFPIYEMTDGDYTVRFLPPQRDPSMMFGKRPTGLKLNGKSALEANVMRIDFHKEEFDRAIAGSIDPPEDVIRRAVGEFHSRLRFTARAAHASAVSFPWSQWRLDYTNDDGSELEAREGYLRGRGSLQFQWSFIGISPEVWKNIFDLPPEFAVPVWNGLRLDALAALPSVGTAVVLAATSLEVFISVLLDRLASERGLSNNLWTWIRDREGRTLQQPSVEEQFDVLLKEFSGHSLKEDTGLWEAFKNLKSARNSFVHEGIARVGKTSLTKEGAMVLVSKVDGIIERIRGWIPEDMQWPVPQAKVNLEWTQMLVEPSDNAVQPTLDGAADD